MTSTNQPSSSSDFYKPFTSVNRRKRKNKPQREREPLLSLVRRIQDELGHDDWFSQCQHIFIESLACACTPEAVLCLGLGSPAVSQNARAQLAFLLSICEALHIDRTRISMYDPVFTADDHELFNELQIQILTENNDAAYAIDRPTLCFMPHCDMELYENIIKANWARSRLPYLFLVANRLADYIDSNPRHKLEVKVPYLLTLALSLRCYPLPASRQWPTAFNNTALQYITGTELGNLTVLE